VAAEAAVVAGETTRRRRPMITLLWITLPFALVVLGCVAMAERSGGWDGLGWAVYGAIAAGLWALAVVVFFVWLMARDGWLAWHGIPLAILLVAAVAGAAWGGKLWLDESRERADAAFYDRLAATPMAERATLLAAEPDRPAAMTFPGRERVALHFLADRYQPLAPESPEDTERLATLALLLDHGMPPDDFFFYKAVADADPAVVRLLIERRLALGRGWEPIPPRFVVQALDALDADPASPYHAPYERYLAILALVVELGFDPCQPASGTESFAQAFARRDVPREIWAEAAEAC